MTERQIWNDDAREELRNTLRNLILGELRLAHSDREHILNTLREAYIEVEECPESERGAFIQFASDEFDKFVSRNSLEQAAWPRETDCDRLDLAEASLRDRGILLWQVSPCCDTCTGAELPDRIDEIERRQPGFRARIRGYAFFIDQNMADMLGESTQLSVYLAYGWFSPDAENADKDVYKAKALGIATEVCECLREHGLEPDWDGEFTRKIGLSLNWQRRAALK